MRFSRSTTAIALCLATLAPVAASAEAYEYYRDIRPNHWAWNGNDPLVVQSLIEKITRAGTGAEYPDIAIQSGSGAWTSEFSTLGDQYRRLAEVELEKGLNGAAANYLILASAAYSMAKYPLIQRTDAELEAFEASLETLHQAYELQGLEVERISVPTPQGEPNGHLIVPAGSAPTGGWPVVIASNGIDVNQGEFFHFVNMLTERGVAILTYDIAGTGTNASIPLQPDYEWVPVALAENIGQRADINRDAMAIMGVSFGGNAATKLAHTKPDMFRAAVNMCGPIHEVFQIPLEHFEAIHIMYRDALFARTGIEPGKNAALLELMRQFSLVDQGVIKPGEVTTNVPILSVNARNDNVAPEVDIDLVTASTTDGTVILSGTDDHCPQDRFVVMPQVADWISKHLQVTGG